jgi:elongation factor 2
LCRNIALLGKDVIHLTSLIELCNSLHRKILSTKQEQERGFLIRCSPCSVLYTPEDSSILPPNADGREFLINLVATPGHPELFGNVTAALRITDGAIVVIECNEWRGFTEELVELTMKERVKPVLFFDKLQRY